MTSDALPQQAVTGGFAPAVAGPAIAVPGGRDPRIDVFRGLALVMIFIDHVPDRNIYAGYTLLNFGLSDAAEAFVLMSGMSAGLAYGLYFRPPMRFWTGLGRVWKRAWTIYLVHLLVSVWGLAVTAMVAEWYGDILVMWMNQIGVLLEEPKQFVIGLPILAQQLDYGDILPLYAALVFAAPLALILAWRHPWWLVAGSVALWWAAAAWKLDLPSWTREYGWYFNPFSW